jgi:ribulose-phosphate 3-epimerase
MPEIIPAILPKNYEDLKNKIALVRGASSLVQIDICDGVFVSSQTWPYSTGGASDYNFQRILNEEEGMPFWEDIDFELDLMVSDAVENFDIYTKLGAKRIVFHIGAVGNLEEFKNFLEGIDIYIRESLEIGVALGINMSLEHISPIISNVDFVQCMGIEKVGYQGQDFNERVIENIKMLRESFPNVTISVDGGVDFDNASLLLDAGADRLIIGSAIFNTDDIIGTIEEFRNL